MQRLHRASRQLVVKNQVRHRQHRAYVFRHRCQNGHHDQLHHSSHCLALCHGPQLHQDCRRQSLSHKHRVRPASLTLDPMKLHVARLCLDCEEIHDEQACPLCGSASFGYISRWIPAPERRTRPRPVITSPTADTYRELLAPDQARSDKSRWLRRGVVGVTAVSLAGWIWRRKLAENRRETKSEGQVKG